MSLESEALDSGDLNSGNVDPGSVEPINVEPSNVDQRLITRVRGIDAMLTHVWMVRTFLKHCDEAEEDDDLREVVRDLYDFILAVGPVDDAVDPKAYLKMAKKKLRRIKGATELYETIQPEVSGHTNFVMAARSLRLAVDAIESLTIESLTIES